MKDFSVLFLHVVVFDSIVLAGELLKIGINLLKLLMLSQLI
jgi:hypothetical protein